ncbi:hypothetical protein B296_00027058 [Ensete ventricosum]|uniref:Uncharacterized protein n=1 Tax=Ensete ventricosum TaxID=4639 RepID=A0A426ZJ54_ENSVE|nr:hypothetical protein B296_00027058 [Ensete ventricosum]
MISCCLNWVDACWSCNEYRLADFEVFEIQQYVLPTSFLIEHSYINLKSLTFGYLDKKLIDTGLMKFLGLCPFALYWYLEFNSAFSTSSAFFTTKVYHHESKGSMTSWKSRLCGTMTLPAHGPYYLLPCICVPFFALGRFASAALWHSSESSFLTDVLLLGK